MARVCHVKKARKDQGSCSGCGKKIKRGDAYKWVKLTRYSSKRKKCDSCRFRDSELTTSDKLSELYGAREDAEDRMTEMEVVESLEAHAKADVKPEHVYPEHVYKAPNLFEHEDYQAELESIRDELAERVREVGEGYRESADNIREHFSESSTADECEEKADELDGWADEIEGTDFDAFEFDSSSEDTMEEQLDAWADQEREKLSDVVGNCPV